MNHIVRCHEIVEAAFVRGENCYLYDSEGRRFVDFESGIWSAAIGHGHPRINDAIRAQIEKITHLGTRYPSALAETAAVDILDIVGINNGKCVLLSSGSEAVEFAVQAARRTATGPLFLTFSNSYLAAYGSAGRRSADEWCLLDWSACVNSDPRECLKSIPFDKIGAFVFEPGGSGSGFITFPPKHLVQDIVRRVKRAGGTIVANEVTTGMGRTGKWFGFQHYDIQPDIVALGKGLGNGYPVSAVAIRRDIADELERSGFHYAQSHQNDPLGCAVATEVIATLAEENLIERAHTVGTFFLEGLKQLAAEHGIVREARGRGMVLGLELFPHERLSVQAVYRSLFQDGFLVGYYSAGNVIRFDPALTIANDDITRLLESLDRILHHADSTTAG